MATTHKMGDAELLADVYLVQEQSWLFMVIACTKLYHLDQTQNLVKERMEIYASRIDD